MEQAMWNKWINKIDNSSIDEMNYELSVIENDEEMPFVEKNIKLGYIYYSKDCLGTATKMFQSVAEKFSEIKNNFDFIPQKEKDENVAYMGWYISPNGCGGYECIENDCCSDGCGPICGCLGIIAAMSICGLSADDVCSYDASSGESGGCVGNGITGCCNGVAPCCGCDTEFT
jgi:hypothetical protein